MWTTKTKIFTAVLLPAIIWALFSLPRLHAPSNHYIHSSPLNNVVLNTSESTLFAPAVDTHKELNNAAAETTTDVDGNPSIVKEESEFLQPPIADDDISLQTDEISTSIDPDNKSKSTTELLNRQILRQNKK